MKNIVYLGIPGSFTHAAAEKYFGKDHTYIGAKTVSDVFEQVKHADFGVVPLENSLHGNVVESFDLLGEHNLFLVGEVYMRIHHCLLGWGGEAKENTFKTVKRCHSHWQAISQCEPFFKNHPWITPVYANDTATAAKEVALLKKNTDVAIASLEAATLYALDVLATDIEKYGENYTRFGIIAKTARSTGEKVTLSFAVHHAPGSLVQALTPFAKNGVNLMQIESRPIRNTPWEYNFYVDVEIGSADAAWQKTIKELKEATTEIKILGRYDKGTLYET